jgi:hypothetical protein
LPTTTLPQSSIGVWERIDRGLMFVVVGSLVFLLVAPLAMLLTARFHHDPRADEKMVALGLGVLFASIALMFLTRLTRSLEAGETLGLESHWGGLGGGVGGWRISRPVGYLFCVMTFGALASVAGSRYPDPPPSELTGGTRTPATTTKPAASPPGTTTTTTTQTEAAPPKPKTEPSKSEPSAPAEGPPKPDAASGRAAPPKSQ